MARRGRTPPPYGSRGRPNGVDVGIRRVAPTFGKVLHLTGSAKAGDRLAVESDAERLAVHMLTLDPRVAGLSAQPLTVDLIDGRLLWNPEDVAAARTQHRGRAGPRFYTPDLAVEWHGQGPSFIEVKVEGYEGDEAYAQSLLAAARVLEAHGYRLQFAVIPAYPHHPLHSNVPLLRSAALRRDLWPSAELTRKVEQFLAGGAVSVGGVCRALEISPNLIPVLLASGAVSADLFASHIYAAMPLERSDGDLSHLMLIDRVIR